MQVFLFFSWNLISFSFLTAHKLPHSLLALSLSPAIKALVMWRQMKRGNPTVPYSVSGSVNKQCAKFSCLLLFYPHRSTHNEMEKNRYVQPSTPHPGVRGPYCQLGVVNNICVYQIVEMPLICQNTKLWGNFYIKCIKYQIPNKRNPEHSTEL